ncbi:CLUMA_CG014359, isoform A [Clunio marinus]|uniref:CLUMA_CG014359, isoform A n=1 Tax=Clunio marinus TaxID=568069 RepID=A0A1J1IML9_9DIPT|nr:CLUMA_CG014359, isoform A [Clunio marinus]
MILHNKMQYFYFPIFSFTWAFLLISFLHSTSASISKYPDSIETSKLSLEPINGTKNFRMHGKKSKDDKWTWEGREGRYIYCVREAEAKCEELEYTKQCFGRNIPYPSTTLDLTKYYSQDQSLEQLISYQALKHVPKCWAVIQPFLCAVFFPKCENINGVDMVYLPSLEMCKITMEPCRILYNSSYFPDFLKCNETNFPSKCNNDVREMKFNLTGQCLKPLVTVEDPANSYKDIEGCGIECKDPLYTDDEHRQIRQWIAWGASLCLVLHIFACFTFAIDWRNSDSYPTLIIFFVNLCCMISCIGWLAQFNPGSREDIVCRVDNTLKQGEPSGGENLSCIIVFIFVYYFQIAEICWFVIFTYAYYMNFNANGRFQERIDKKASYFHLIAWSIPLVMTISILAISEVDGISIVGICFVGYVNHAIRGGAVLGPVLCELIIGGFFLIRGLVILINVKNSSKQIISKRASKKVDRWILRMEICGVLRGVIIVIILLCHIYEFKNASGWSESLRNFIICKITSTYSDDDSLTCKLLNRPSIAILQVELLAFFASKIVMASFVFTPSTIKIWRRFIRTKLGHKVEEPVKFQKHKMVKQAYAMREVLQNRGRLSISFHNSHTDPVGLKFDMNSAVGSNDFSTTWANNLPAFVTRRNAFTECASTSSDAHSWNSIDSEISFSVRHVSVESRRSSNDSQVSVKIAEMKTKVASRSRGSKSKPRSSRHQRKDFTTRRNGRKESSTSMESQIVAMAQKRSRHVPVSESDMVGGMLVPIGAKRRSGISSLAPAQIHELIERNKILLPFLTTSEDEKSSVGSLNLQDSKLDVILKQIGLSEEKIIDNKFKSDDNNGDSGLMEMQVRKSNSVDISDFTSDDNLTTGTGRMSKNSNRSIGSKKSLKTGNMRLRRIRKTSKSSVAKSANLLTVTNGSGRIKTDKKSEKEKKLKDKEKIRTSHDLKILNGNLQGSTSGRSNVGIQTEIPSETFSSIEHEEKTKKQITHDDNEDDDQSMETHKLLSKHFSLSSSMKRRDTNETSLTESEKLKLLLLPSK